MNVGIWQDLFSNPDGCLLATQLRQTAELTETGEGLSEEET
jgi:hypothetical protein